MSADRIVCMWSGPRNLSTAMMYSWRQRSDTTVWDEPMYAHYLLATGVDHPGRDETIAAWPTAQDEILDAMLNGDAPTPVRFYKNMAHHLVGFDWSVIDHMDNYLLTRNPSDMLSSLAAGFDRAPTLLDTGFEQQIEILERIIASGREPIVVDSRDVLEGPRSVLSQLCERLGLPFQEAMLSWPPGPKPEDGVWAKYWYGRLHETTGFEPHRPKREALPVELQPLHDRCVPLYERLSSYSIRP